MVQNRRFLLFLALFSLVSLPSLQAHEGVDHGTGDEVHSHLEVLTAGPDGRYQVSIVYLPEAPSAGQKVQFLLGLEEDLGVDDPLLGGLGPFQPQGLEVWLTGEDGSRTAIPLQEEEETGVYRFEHAFPEAGSWEVAVEFKDETGEPSLARITLPVEHSPANWPLLAFQGMVLLACAGLLVQRFWTSALTPGSAAFAVVVLAVGIGAVFLASSLWAPQDLGTLEIAALHPPEPESEEPPGLFAETGATAEQPRFISSRRMLVGTVRNAVNRNIQIRSPLPGTVVFKNGVPKIGDPVRSGQVLGVIQNQFIVHDYSHLLNQRWELLKVVIAANEAQVQAEAEYQRAASLLDLGIISRREFQQKELAFREADTAMKKAQERLDLHDKQLRRSDLHETELVSPIDGYVANVTYSAGQMIYEDDPILELVDHSVVWVEAFAPPESLSRVTSSTRVRLHSNVLEQEFSGQLVSVRPDVDPQSRTVQILYEVPNPDSWLKPGMMIDVYPAAATQGEQAAEAGSVRVGG